MKLLSFLVGWFFLTVVISYAAVPYPKVYNDFTFELAGQYFGITETEKVVTDEFQQRIVPGKQIIVSLGPTYFVMPFPMLSLLLWLVALFLCLGAGVFFKRRSAVRKCNNQ